MAHPKWFEEVKASRQLPSPTGVALRVLRLAEMEETSAAELARALQADPALAGRVLKYANSSLFAPGRPVVALLDAVTYLGMRSVQRLVLGLSVVAQYRRSSCKRFNHPQYWSRSLAAAIAARMLSKATRRGESDELFVCGLLSEVGALALATVHPQAYDKVLEQAEGRPWLERLRLEQRTFAMDEVDLTAAMIQDWGLPERYVQVVLGLKQLEEGEALPEAGPEHEGEAAERSLVWLLRLARQVALYCTGEVERPRQASALLGLAGVAGLTASSLAGVVDRVGKEWQEWAQQVGAPSAEVPCVLEAAQEARGSVGALLDPGEVVEADSGRLRVLVADGDAAALRKLAADVQAAGYEAITARDGREALHTALDAWPEVLVVDSHLPGMDGLALCRLLRKTRPGQEVYVILLTAAGSDEEVVAAFDAGADDYCARPWSPRVLAARLRAGERSVRLQRTLEQEKEEVRQVAARLTVEQRQLEGQLRQAQKMDAIGRLAGGVAHDFNNLLTVINGYAQLLGARLGAGDGCREMVQQIARAGERATSLTRQLLTFSRQAVIEPKVLDLNAVIGESEKMLRRLIGEHIQLEAVPGAGLWRVRSDPGQIDQVLLNLAVNARDAMPQGGKLTIRTGNVEVTEEDLGLRPDARPGPHVALTVSDTGCGMAADVKSHIFEPFYTTKEPGKGTGLGLATVYGIVKQSGGHIRVESEVGRGTTFEIYLPRASEAELAAEAAPQRVAPVGGSGRLLLVEDEETVRSFIGAALRGAGYQVLEACDGRDALALLDRESVPVQLVVTDVVMPRMGGPQLVEVLRQREPGIKVVYVSGYADDTVLRAGALDGGAAFVQKPFAPGALTHKVRELLGA